MRLARSVVLLATAVFAGSGGFVAAQESPSSYPTRPIKLIVPYPPGALTDLLARSLAERLRLSLKQPIVVENKAGAGTLIGAEYVAHQPPDGYTLLMATSTTLGISPALYPKSPIDPVKDFAPVAMVGPVTFFLIANNEFPAKDMTSFLTAVKAKPGYYNYASVGSGSPHHLFMEALKTQTGFDAQHVPYKGTVAAIPDLLTGKIHFMFSDATAALPQIRAGKVVALGTSGARETTLASGVPPIGRTVPGFEALAWQGIVAPAGTPPEIVARLNAELNRIVGSEEFRQQLTTFGMEANPMSSEAFSELVRSDVSRWAEAVRKSGAKVE
jgi:tripartite-type tricarboxylate transporter receptor subunit TctC